MVQILCHAYFFVLVGFQWYSKKKTDKTSREQEIMKQNNFYRNTRLPHHLSFEKSEFFINLPFCYFHLGVGQLILVGISNNV